MALTHTVSECQSDESGEFAIFLAQNRLPRQRPLRYSKKGPDRSSTPKKLSFNVKIAKIGPTDLEIICLREIIKKDKKERKYISLPASLPSGLKKRKSSYSSSEI